MAESTVYDKKWNNSAERLSLTPSSCTDNYGSNSNNNKFAHNKSFKLLSTKFVTGPAKIGHVGS